MNTVISKKNAQEYMERKYFPALFPVYSFLNHCCMPNTTMFSIGNFNFIVANADIKKGEEITTGYKNGDYEER